MDIWQEWVAASFASLPAFLTFVCLDFCLPLHGFGTMFFIVVVVIVIVIVVVILHRLVGSLAGGMDADVFRLARKKSGPMVSIAKVEMK